MKNPRQKVYIICELKDEELLMPESNDEKYEKKKKEIVTILSDATAKIKRLDFTWDTLADRIKRKVNIQITTFEGKYKFYSN